MECHSERSEESRRGVMLSSHFEKEPALSLPKGTIAGEGK
jgi:hypothetical protein